MQSKREEETARETNKELMRFNQSWQFLTRCSRVLIASKRLALFGRKQIRPQRAQLPVLLLSSHQSPTHFLMTDSWLVKMSDNTFQLPAHVCPPIAHRKCTHICTHTYSIYVYTCIFRILSISLSFIFISNQLIYRKEKKSKFLQTLTLISVLCYNVN